MAERPYPRWSFDLEERLFAPRKEPLPTPVEGIADSPYVCVQINQKWISHIMGALEVLNVDDAWIGTENEIFNARQEVEKLMFALAGAGNCADMGLTDVRITGGGLEKTFDGGLTWIPVGSVGAAPFSTVTATTLAPGAAATATIAADVLELGIPAGADGDDGTDGINGDDGTNGASAELRKTTTAIQWRQDDNSPTWADLVLLSEITGAAGAAGSPGAPGAPGSPGADGQDCDDCTPGQPSPEETTTDDEGRLCAGATGLTDWLIDILQYNIDQLQLVTQITSGVIDIVLLNLDEVASTGAQFTPVVGSVVDALQLLFTAGPQLIEVQLSSPAYREKVFCKLYCLAKDAGGFNESVFTAWLGNLGSDTPDVHLANVGNIVGYAAVSRRFAIYATGSSVECDLCTECPLTHATFPDSTGVKSSTSPNRRKARIGASSRMLAALPTLGCTPLASAMRTNSAREPSRPTFSGVCLSMLYFPAETGRFTPTPKPSCRLLMGAIPQVLQPSISRLDRSYWGDLLSLLPKRKLSGTAASLLTQPDGHSHWRVHVDTTTQRPSLTPVGQ